MPHAERYERAEEKESPICGPASGTPGRKNEFPAKAERSLL